MIIMCVTESIIIQGRAAALQNCLVLKPKKNLKSCIFKSQQNTSGKNRSLNSTLPSFFMNDALSQALSPIDFQIKHIT